MVHLALWLISSLIVIAVLVPLFFVAVALVASRTFWLIVGIGLVFLGGLLACSYGSLGLGIVVLGAILTTPGLLAED